MRLKALIPLAKINPARGIMSWRRDSNSQPTHYKCVALPIAPLQHRAPIPRNHCCIYTAMRYARGTRKHFSPGVGKRKITLPARALFQTENRIAKACTIPTDCTDHPQQPRDMRYSHCVLAEQPENKPAGHRLQDIHRRRRQGRSTTIAAGTGGSHQPRALDRRDGDCRPHRGNPDLVGQLQLGRARTNPLCA